MKEEGEALGSLGSHYLFSGNYRRGNKYYQQGSAIAQAFERDRFRKGKLEDFYLIC